MYYRETVGTIIVCNASNPRDFDYVSKWKSSVDEACDPLPTILLVNTMNKEPCASSFPDETEKEQIDKFCAEIGIFAWFIVSPKTKDLCDEAVLSLIKAIVASENENGVAPDAVDPQSQPQKKCMCQ